MIKYNNSNIIDWNFGDDNIIKVYRNNAVCYYKVTSGDTPSRLPSGYTEVEYVESTGNTGLNLGTTANQDTRIVAVMQTVTSTLYGRLLGAGSYDKTNAIQFDYEIGANGTLNVSWGTVAGWTTYSNCIGDTDVHEYDWDKNYFYRDKGTVNEFSATTTFGNFQTTDPIALFCNYHQAFGGMENYWNGRCYSCQVYDDGTLIRDLVPCTRDSDSKAGMYDIVNDVFYYPPSGKSDLIAGQPI